MLCKRYLQRTADSCFEVDHATDAKSGLMMCHENDYDCLVLDYYLPDSTGAALLQDIQRNAGTAVLPPAIFLTSSRGQDVAIDAIRSQASDFMLKSDVTATTLAYAVENALSKAKLRNQLQANHQTLERTCQELEKKNEEITRFYHTVSHEVKTPLTAMLEFVQLLSEGVVGPVTEDQERILAFTSECCHTISKHFDDLLEITRFDTGKLHLELELCKINDLVDCCVLGAQGVARAKEVTLKSELDNSAPCSSVDQRRVQQVVANLIDNALKFTDAGGCITVQTGRSKGVDASDDASVILVSDTGCGIASEHQAKIFERLYQVEDGAQHEAAPEGLGLGLCIIREIVAAHHGDISVQSTPGVGTTFTVSLPIQQPVKQPVIEPLTEPLTEPELRKAS